MLLVTVQSKFSGANLDPFFFLIFSIHLPTAATQRPPSPFPFPLYIFVLFFLFSPRATSPSSAGTDDAHFCRRRLERRRIDGDPATRRLVSPRPAPPLLSLSPPFCGRLFLSITPPVAPAQSTLNGVFAAWR